MLRQIHVYYTILFSFCQYFINIVPFGDIIVLKKEEVYEF